MIDLGVSVYLTWLLSQRDSDHFGLEPRYGLEYKFSFYHHNPLCPADFIWVLVFMPKYPTDGAIPFFA